MDLADRRVRAVLEAVLILWTAAWIGVGVWVYHEVRDLRRLSTTVILAGIAMENTAEAVDSLSDLPFVGKQTKEVARNARVVARSAKRSGFESRKSVEDLARLLGVAIAIAPTIPILVFYGFARNQVLRGRRR